MACGALKCICRERGYEPWGKTPRPAEMDEHYGCTRDAAVEWYEIGGKGYRRCAAMIASPESVRVVNAHTCGLERGFLPVDGGWLDQAATFTDAVGIIDTVYAERDREALEEARRKG